MKMSKVTVIVLVSAVAISCVLLGIYPQLPGVAIGVMAAAAAIMVFVEMHAVGKTLLTICIIALFVLEMRNIKQDRRESDQKAHNERVEDQKRLKEILDNNQDAFSKTIQGLNGVDIKVESNLKEARATLSRLNGVAALAKKSIDLNLGGDSICYFDMNISDQPVAHGPTRWPIEIQTIGEYPVYDVMFSISSLNDPAMINGKPSYVTHRFDANVGTIAPGQTKDYSPEQIFLDGDSQQVQKFLGIFTARNGLWFEQIHIVITGDRHWQRQLIVQPGGNHQPVSLMECRPKKFPESLGGWVFTLANACPDGRVWAPGVKIPTFNHVLQ